MASTQEYITPYTPEQNGMIERFFLTLKQECVWLHRFESRDHAFRVVADWLDRYHADRPHSALGYLTPKEYREKLGKLCTGNRAEAGGWLIHESAPVETEIDLVVSLREPRGAGVTRVSVFTGRTSPLAAAAGGGPGRDWRARTG